MEKFLRDVFSGRSLGVRGLAGTPGARGILSVYNTTPPNHPFYTERRLQRCSCCGEWFNTTDEIMVIHRDPNICKGYKTLSLIGPNGSTCSAPDGSIFSAHTVFRKAEFRDATFDEKTMENNREGIAKVVKEELDKIYASEAFRMIPRPEVFTDWAEVPDRCKVAGQIVQIADGTLNYTYVHNGIEFLRMSPLPNIFGMPVLIDPRFPSETSISLSPAAIPENSVFFNSTNQTAYKMVKGQWVVSEDLEDYDQLNLPFASEEQK